MRSGVTNDLTEEMGQPFPSSLLKYRVHMLKLCSCWLAAHGLEEECCWNTVHRNPEILSMTIVDGSFQSSIMRGRENENL